MDRKGRTLFVLGFLAPALLTYGYFVLWPFVQALEFSAYRWRGLSMKRTFIGGDNFQKLAKDEVFWKSIGNNIFLLVACGIAIVGIAVAVAHATKGDGRTAKVLRSVYLLPQVISLVAVAVMWQFVFNPQGLLNGALRGFGWSNPPAWLGDPKFALGAVGVAFAWYALGFYIMLFAAGIQSIPEEVFEAAQLDGSQGLHRFHKVTWPLLWSVKKVAVVYLVINVMGVFALVQLMTRGGPDRKSEVMLTYLYEQAFTNYQFGYATAVGLGNFVVIMALSALVLFWFRKDPTARRG